MKDILQLLRIKHYIKNGLVLVPLLFSGGLFTRSEALWLTLIGAAAFCLLSSSMYVVNDICDVEKDRSHPVKSSRPIASGAVSMQRAWLLAAVCMLATAALSIFLTLRVSYACGLILLIYFLLNISYSCGLKNKPLIEIAVLASGFALRVFFGGCVSGVEVSDWLFLTVICVSFYLGLGKRRNELERHGNKSTRKVLRHYSRAFLDKNMYMFLCLSIGFYSLWAIEHPRPLMHWSIPFVMLICMRYSLRVEGASEGDPVDMILKDKTLLVLGGLYACFLMFVLYH